MGYLASKETVVLGHWGNKRQKCCFINRVDHVDWLP